MPMPHIILGYPDEIGGPRITFPKGADRGKFSANLMRYLTSHLSQHQAMVYQIVNNPESKGKYVVLRFDGVTVALALERIGLDHEAVTNAPRQHGLQVRVLEVWPGTGHSPTLAELVATDERMWPPNFRGGSDNKRGLQNRSDGGGNRSLQSGHGGRKGKGAKVIDITDYL
jgi:hypothetical protein